MYVPIYIGTKLWSVDPRDACRGARNCQSIINIMTEVLKLGKKVFTFGVVTTTIMWSVGFAALVPTVAQAADACPALDAGMLVKVQGNPVIYVLDKDKKVQSAIDNKVAVVAGKKVYQSALLSWQDTTKYSYKTVSYDCIAQLQSSKSQLGVRPGSYVVRHPITKYLYVTLPGKVGLKVSDAVAKKLYGSNYVPMDVTNLEFGSMYETSNGPELTEAVPHDGMFVSKDSKTYYVAGGKLIEVTASGLSANKVNTTFVRSYDAAMLSTLTVDTAKIDSYDARLSDRSQSGVIPSATPVVTPVGGALTVSLAADTPAAANLADGTSYNPMLKLNLTSGSATTQVTGITLTKVGLIANTNISGVSVWDKDGKRHGDIMSTLTSDGKVTVSFANNPILVAAGGTETLTVKVNLGSNAASSLVGFKVNAATDVVSNGTVGGTFPITGNQMSIIDGASAVASFTVASSSVGGITDGSESTASAANVEIGAVQKEVAKFRFTETSGLEDMYVDAITFYMQGSAQDSFLKNFTVYSQDGAVLGTAASAKDRYVTVKLTVPYLIAKSTNKDLSLKVDVVDGSGYNFRVHIQNDYDVMVRGATTGYYINPTYTSTFDTKETNGWFEMKSGSLIVNKNAASVSGNVSAGTQGYVLASIDVKAVGESMELRKMGLSIATSSAATTHKLTGNVSVVDAKTGSVYLTVAASDANLYAAAGYQYSLSNYISLASNETKTLNIVGNVDANAASTESYQAGLGNFYVKRLSTLDFTDNNPSSSNLSAQGNALTVNTTSLTCNKDTSMGDVTRSTGATVEFGRYICTAGTSEDVRLTGVNVYFGNSGNAANTLQNVSLWDGSTQLGSTLGTVASSSNNINFDITIAKNQTKTLSLHAYLVTGQTGTVSSSLFSYNYTGKSSGTSNTGATVVGQNVSVGSGALTIAAVSDASTVASIYGPGQTGVQLGKWKLSASNDDLTLKKITLAARYANGSNATTLGTFGTLSLYDGSNKLADGNYVAGNVVFTGLNLPIVMDGYKVLTLKGNINASGVMTNATTTVFVLKSDGNTDMEVYAGAGGLLTAAQINGGSTTASSSIVTSSYAIFHDAYPVVAPVSIGTTLSVASNAKLFEFTVTNPGTRDLNIASTTITINASGMTGDGTATGSISNFKLYEANSTGDLGTYIANVPAAGIDTFLAGGKSLVLVPSIANNTTTAAITSLNVSFNNSVDTPGLLDLDSLLVAPGSSRTFILTADTTNVSLGKTTGTITVSAKITGTTGFDSTNFVWNTGNLRYYYYQAGSGATRQGPYYASDSYDVTGGSLQLSL